MAKKKEVNLSDIDANFVISSFKNKERLNNPSSIPRALLPPWEDEQLKKERESKAVNESTNADRDSVDGEVDITNGECISDTSTTTDKPTVSDDNTKRINLRQRKAAFEEYRKLFLTTPKITHRKPVFISEGIRERLDEISRRLGDKGMSASGFLENMALHHLKMYEDDIEFWRKL